MLTCFALNVIEKNKKKFKSKIDFGFEYPPKLKDFLSCRKMYQILYGGRSSGKTHSIIQKIIERTHEKENQTILCTREYQTSIASSTYAELKQIINLKNLEHFFKIKHDRIEHINGSVIIFKGLARDISSIKSIPNITLCFVEEAENITQEHWETLDPTLRTTGCELIVAFNPKEKTSATYQKWIESPIPEKNIYRVEINYPDNPYNSSLIFEKIAYMREHDYARYEHIYLGKVLDMSEDVIFKNKFKILDMQVEFKYNKFFYRGSQIAPLYGMDFGFSQDPTAMIEIFFLDENTIYINREYYQTQLLPSFYKNAIKLHFGEYALSSRWYADSARPDTIAQLNYDGLKIEGAQKFKNSIESGIEYLMGKNIVIDPKCTNMIYEAYNYRYKQDKNSGAILNEAVDKDNHLWDAIRYACYKQISAMRQRNFSFDKSKLLQMGIR